MRSPQEGGDPFERVSEPPAGSASAKETRARTERERITPLACASVLSLGGRVEDGWHGRIVSGVKCQQCGDPLPATARRNRRYCDARCRRRAFEDRHAPAGPELAPVVPISDNEQVQELLTRVLAEERLVAQVAAGAKTNWRAAAWLLERRYPERWGPVRPQDESEPGAPVVVGADDPFQEVDQLAAKRRARRDGE
jgi:hypothetical protein